MTPPSTTWRRIAATFAGCAAAAIVAWLLLPAHKELRVDPARDMPFDSLPVGSNPFTIGRCPYAQ